MRTPMRTLCTAKPAISVTELAREHKVRLTEGEMRDLTRQLDQSGDGMVDPAELEAAGRLPRRDPLTTRVDLRLRLRRAAG